MHSNQRSDVCKPDGDSLKTFTFPAMFNNDLKFLQLFSLMSFDINYGTKLFNSYTLEDRSGHSYWKIVFLYSEQTPLKRFHQFHQCTIQKYIDSSLVPRDISRYSRCRCVVLFASNLNMHSTSYFKIVVFYSTDFIDTIITFLKNGTEVW